MKLKGVLALAVFAVTACLSGASPGAAVDPGIGNVPQGTQTDKAYAQSVQRFGVTNVDATTQQVSCYRPEVSAAAFNDGPTNGYTGESACPGATTGEDTGAAAPYPTQAGSNPGYPMSAPQLVKDHSESDLRVDPRNPLHLIGSSKWIVSAEGYNHLLGFYESFDGGKTWPMQGHIPGYEGWTDNTDPVGAFDTNGNFYEFVLAYQFFYNADGSHNFTVGGSQEPNPVQPAEVVAMAVRQHGSTTAGQWITTTHTGALDFVATYDAVGNEPDKQWLTIDTGASSPFMNRVYAMWVDFHGPFTPVPYVSYADALSNGTHTAWSAPQPLPTPPHTPQGATYLLPHVDPNGVVYTTLTNENPRMSSFASTISVDRSTDGGKTWAIVSTPIVNAALPPFIYPNTTFRDGITDTFAIGNQLDAQGKYPLYIAYEDGSAGLGNLLLIASYDGGTTWTSPIQINDNAGPVDELQPNLTVAADGTVSVNFYDRRLACPASGAEASGAGLALDPNAPFGASNYCVNASVQFYSPTLNPIGHNIRLTQHTWDPQLNAPHPGSPGGKETFIGDYFGNVTSGSTDLATFVSTFDDGSNPSHYQQQVVASVAIP